MMYSDEINLIMKNVRSNIDKITRVSRKYPPRFSRILNKEGYFQRGQVRFVGENFEIWNRFSIDFTIEIIILESKNLKMFACGALSDVHL